MTDEIEEISGSWKYDNQKELSGPDTEKEISGSWKYDNR